MASIFNDYRSDDSGSVVTPCFLLNYLPCFSLAQSSVFISKIAKKWSFKEKVEIFSKKILFYYLIVIQLIGLNFGKTVNNFNEKKLLKNLPVSKMAVPLHRFSPLVWR